MIARLFAAVELGCLWLVLFALVAVVCVVAAGWSLWH